MGAWVPVEERRAALDARRGGFGPLRAAPEAASGSAEKQRGIVRSAPKERTAGPKEKTAVPKETAFRRLLRRSWAWCQWRFAVSGSYPAPEELRGFSLCCGRRTTLRRRGVRGGGLACLVDADRVQAWRVGIERPGDERERERRGRWGGRVGGERERVTSWRTNTRRARRTRKTTLSRSCRRSWRRREEISGGVTARRSPGRSRRSART